MLDRIARRKKRVSSKIFGTLERPRISVFKSNNYLYAQAIDDNTHHTLVAASTMDKKDAKAIKSTVNKANSAELGRKLADLLKAKKIEAAVLDRGIYAYKGNVQAFTDGLRENGIKI